VSVEIAVNPAAAVHIKECGQSAIRRRRVEPKWNLAAGAWEASVLDERDIFELARERRRAQAVHAARLHGSLLRQRRQAERGHVVEVSAGLRVDHKTEG